MHTTVTVKEYRHVIDVFNAMKVTDQSKLELDSSIHISTPKNELEEIE